MVSMYVPFEQIDEGGDVGLKVRGKKLEELFENAAKGLFGLITDINTIEIKENRQLTIDADNKEDLLVKWLNDLIFIFDSGGFVARKFDIAINQFKDKSLILKAILQGGNFDPGRHESRLLIKAATYHNLSITEKNGMWEAIIIFDI